MNDKIVLTHTEKKWSELREDIPLNFIKKFLYTPRGLLCLRPRLHLKHSASWQPLAEEQIWSVDHRGDKQNSAVQPNDETIPTKTTEAQNPSDIKPSPSLQVEVKHVRWGWLMISNFSEFLIFWISNLFRAVQFLNSLILTSYSEELQTILWLVDLAVRKLKYGPLDLVVCF